MIFKNTQTCSSPLSFSVWLSGLMRRKTWTFSPLPSSQLPCLKSPGFTTGFWTKTTKLIDKFHKFYVKQYWYKSNYHRNPIHLHNIWVFSLPVLLWRVGGQVRGKWARAQVNVVWSDHQTLLLLIQTQPLPPPPQRHTHTGRWLTGPCSPAACEEEKKNLIFMLQFFCFFFQNLNAHN